MIIFEWYLRLLKENSINKSTHFKISKFIRIRNEIPITNPQWDCSAKLLKIQQCNNRQARERERISPTTNRENCCVHYAQLSYFRSSAFNPVKSCSEERKVGFEARQFQSWKSQREQRRCLFFLLSFFFFFFFFPPLLSVQALLIPRHNTGTWFRSVRFERMPRRPRVHRDTKSFLFDNEESAYPPQWPPGKRFSTVPLKRTKPPP